MCVFTWFISILCSEKHLSHCLHLYGFSQCVSLYDIFVSQIFMQRHPQILHKTSRKDFLIASNYLSIIFQIWNVLYLYRLYCIYRMTQIDKYIDTLFAIFDDYMIKQFIYYTALISSKWRICTLPVRKVASVLLQIVHENGIASILIYSQ